MRIKQSWIVGAITGVWLGFSLAAFTNLSPFGWRFYAVSIPTIILYNWYAYRKEAEAKAEAEENIKNKFLKP